MSCLGRSLFFLMGLVTLGGSPFAALGYGDPTEVYTSFGLGHFRGDPASSANFQVVGLHSRKVPERRLTMMGSVQRTRVGIGIDLFNGTFRGRGTSPVFPAEGELTMLGVNLIPTTCYYQEEALRLCFGLGVGYLRLEHRNYLHEFGALHYQLDLHYGLTEVFFVKALAKSTGRIRQRIAGETFQTRFHSYGLAAGFYY